MTEEMMRAARSMASAAEDMKQAANWMGEAVAQQRTALAEFEGNMASLMHRFEECVKEIRGLLKP